MGHLPSERNVFLPLLIYSAQILFFLFRPPLRFALFPYTTLFRSRVGDLCSFRTLTATSSDGFRIRSEEHTSELQSRGHLVCRLLLEKKKTPEFLCWFYCIIMWRVTHENQF